jgi:hypothetical protein
MTDRLMTIEENTALPTIAGLVDKTMPGVSKAQRLRIERRLYSEWRRLWIVAQDEV